jgi:hypothetical protein
MRVTQAACVLSAIGFLTVSSGMEVAQAQISGTSRGPANKPAPPPPSGVKGPHPGITEKVIRHAPARDWSTTEVPRKGTTVYESGPRRGEMRPVPPPAPIHTGPTLIRKTPDAPRTFEQKITQPGVRPQLTPPRVR